MTLYVLAAVCYVLVGIVLGECVRKEKIESVYHFWMVDGFGNTFAALAWPLLSVAAFWDWWGKP